MRSAKYKFLHRNEYIDTWHSVFALVAYTQHSCILSRPRAVFCLRGNPTGPTWAAEYSTRHSRIHTCAPVRKTRANTSVHVSTVSWQDWRGGGDTKRVVYDHTAARSVRQWWSYHECGHSPPASWVMTTPQARLRFYLWSKRIDYSKKCVVQNRFTQRPRTLLIHFVIGLFVWMKKTNTHAFALLLYSFCAFVLAWNLLSLSFLSAFMATTHSTICVLFVDRCRVVFIIHASLTLSIHEKKHSYDHTLTKWPTPLVSLTTVGDTWMSATVLVRVCDHQREWSCVKRFVTTLDLL